MTSNEFSLKWNNFSNSMTSGFLSHLSEKDLVDVTFAVDGQLLTAHKLVLSVCSPYFKNIFKENPCQHPVIILKDVRYTEIVALLKFMYQGEVNVRREDLPMFFKVAKTLQITGLEGAEGQIIPLLNNFVNISESQSIDSEYDTTLSDIHDRQENEQSTSDEHICLHSIRKKNIKKRKMSVIEKNYNLVKEHRKNEDSDDQILSDEKDMDDSESITYVKHDTESENTLNDSAEIQLTNESYSTDNSMLSVVEPVTYRLSARGRPQLIYEGYVYNLTSRSEVLNRSHYRCAEQHRGCRGKCSVIAERFMPTGVQDHNHPPGYQSEYDYKKRKSTDTENSYINDMATDSS